MHTLLAAAPSVAQSIAATASAVATGSLVPSDIASFVGSTVPAVLASMLPAGVTSTSPGAIVQPLNLLSPPFEVSATFVGAVSGALVAVRRRFDIVGVMTLALVAGLGGGIIRDVLLQKYGIAAFQHDYLLLTALIAALLGFFFASAIHRGRAVFLLVDAISLGLFAVVGADKAVVALLGIVPAILLGTITSTGGGVLRDVLTGDVPNVLQPGSLYALAAVAGSTTYVMLSVWLGIVKPWAAFVAIGIVLLLRLLSVWLGWQSPTPVDLSPTLARMVPESWRGVAKSIGDRIPNVPAPPGTGWAAPPTPDEEGAPAPDKGRAGKPDRPDIPADGAPGAEDATTGKD
jgi:uncharacterized membrane protein YeiH